MRVRFFHPPRTGGTSICEDWRPTRHEVVGHRKPLPVKPDGEFWYSCTRNPWDRVVSLYCLRHPSLWSRDIEPFREWLLGGMANRKEPRQELARTWQELCAPTVEWNRHADFVVRFENRTDGLAELARILDRPVPTAHAARSTHKRPYPEYYDDETIAYVAGRYAADIEAFGYVFEHERVPA